MPYIYINKSRRHFIQIKGNLVSHVCQWEKRKLVSLSINVFMSVWLRSNFVIDSRTISSFFIDLGKWITLSVILHPVKFQVLMWFANMNDLRNSSSQSWCLNMKGTYLTSISVTTPWEYFKALIEYVYMYTLLYFTLYIQLTPGNSNLKGTRENSSA